MKNVLILHDRFGDYHWSRAKRLREMNSFNVYTADYGSSDNLYGWEKKKQENHFFLSRKSVDDFDLFNRLNIFLKIVSEKKINIVCLPGIAKFDYLIFYLLSKVLSIKIVLFYESWYERAPIKEWFKNFIYKGVDIFYASGSRARNYLIHLGVPCDKVISGYSVIDNDYFNNNIVFKGEYYICVARFHSDKNILFLLDYFKKFQDQKLIIVGGGPLKFEMERLMSPNVTLIEWRQQSEIRDLIQRSRGLILLSTFEPWGLVVNEAVAAGKPIIISWNVGSAPDFHRYLGCFILYGGNEIVNLNSYIELVNSMSFSDLEKIKEDADRVLFSFSLESWACNLSVALDKLFKI